MTRRIILIVVLLLTGLASIGTFAGNTTTISATQSKLKTNSATTKSTTDLSLYFPQVIELLANYKQSISGG